MAGGSHSARGPGAPLGSRAGPAASVAPAGLGATPCWIDVDGAVAGDVLAWRRDGAGGWQALVGAWLPAAAVRPRDGTST